MFNKLLVAGVVLAASSSIAFAANYKADYKGEAPCPTYVFTAGPYVGFSVGSRVNTATDPVHFRGIDGILSLGYGAMLNPAFYLAGEIWGLGTVNVKDYPSTPRTTTFSTKSNWSYGASVLPGYMITDYVLGYVRLGVQRTRFNGQDETENGWHAGLGGQTNLTQNWDLRGEYVYSRYQSVRAIGRPQSDQFNLGLVYKFV